MKMHCSLKTKLLYYVCLLQERLCAETGVYIQNFAGCSKCRELKDQNRAPDSLISKGTSTVEEIDDDITKEITAFERNCFRLHYLQITLLQY